MTLVPQTAARALLVVVIGATAPTESHASPLGVGAASLLQAQALHAGAAEPAHAGVSAGLTDVYTDDGDVTWRVLGTSAAIVGVTSLFTLAGAAVGAAAAFGYFACADAGCYLGDPLGFSSEGPYEPVFIAEGGVLGGIALGAAGLFLSAGVGALLNLESYDEP